ncbi:MULTISPECIES: hypothetical protein [Pseudomonas]|uniref:Lipoprotein n=1 Tax=Pseudomonas aphyarum TaxID=2942629 RepID=A0ABT5PSW2_9PSED|nr:hypothetical protein [Pseudomonas aphyarum]MDD0968882.1 hypothetical protein [Pseudomonas aphyarum]MDD1126967.1 hypothetical protein [Pseudomonas aphyarum]
MPVFKYAKAYRSAALFAACIATIAGCAVPTGTAHLYRAQTVTGADRSAARQLVNVYDPNSQETAIKKAAKGSLASQDVFSIYLTDGYFKYLRDFDGVNEVVIVAEFTEVSSGTKTDTVSKVLGPYLGVADRSGTPFLNKLLYGPKKLESDHINVRLTVLEYDQGENENSAAFLDFITSASQTLSLADPVTAAEIKFAKEVAKSLLSLNKDDVVMQIEFDLVGDTGQVGQQGSFIPLSPGNYVLINRERCSLGNCFGYLTHDGRSFNPVAWLGDAALLVPVALRRGLTDTPDQKALSPIELDKIKQRNQQVVDASGNVFTDKTWLSFSVVKGGDASLWETRRLLATAEDAIQSLSKKGAISGLESPDFKLAQDALNAARAKELQSQATLSFVSPVNAEGEFAPTITTTEYCLSHPATVKTIDAKFYQLANKGVPQALAVADIDRNKAKSTPNNTCYTVGGKALVAGNYEMVAVYGSDLGNQVQRIRYKVEDPAATKAAADAAAAAKAAAAKAAAKPTP